MSSIFGGLDAEAYDRSYSDTQLIRRSAAYFRPHARTVAIVALAVALTSLGATAIPIIISRGIDMLTGNTGLQILLALAGLVTVLGAVGWTFNFVRLRLSARAVGDVVLKLREDAFRATMRHDLSFYDQYASGRIVSRVTSDTQDFATVITLTIDLLSQLVLIGVISVVMLTTNWRLALITLAVGPVVVLVAMIFRGLARRAMQRAQRAQAMLNAIIHETISGIAVAKNFRQEASVYADFRETNHLAYKVQVKRANVFGTIHPVMHAVSGIASGVVIYSGGLLVLDHTVSVGDWYLFVQSLAIFLQPVVLVASFWGQFQQGLAASERVFALIDAEPAVAQIANEQVGPLRGRITFDHVMFRYGRLDDEQPTASGAQAEEVLIADAISNSGLDALPTTPTPIEGGLPRPTGLANGVSDTISATTGVQLNEASALATREQEAGWVLADFSLDIRAGETVAIVGHTGAGKSSLIKLIMRFYEFQGGRLLIDDQDIRRLNLEQYRRQLGLVPQAPFLFSGTVADNIRYGRAEANDFEVEAAARQLGDGSWIEALPAGLQTDVGERGSRLSFGQRQLVALARVLLQDPAILLLDEATASIDPFTEAQVQAGLAAVMRGRTSVVVAHRLSTVRTADRIIVLRNGKIIEEGNHEGLLEQGGHYAELYTTYFRHQTLTYRPWEDADEAGEPIQVSGLATPA
ncbi:MAG: ABC transporter ATP-binding protein [Chloroflexota bacterium]